MHSFSDKQEILLDIVLLLSRILDLEEGKSLSHGLRVANLSQEIARQLNHGNPPQLFIAGLLHDIGGLSLKKHILHYALDDFNDIDSRNHSTRGAALLQGFPHFQHLAGWVADHHERYDGTGFPAGKSTHEITSEAGILHLADLLDIFFRREQNVTLKTIRTFLNHQSASSVAPIIVEAAKQLFSTPEQLELLQKNSTQKQYGPRTEVYFSEINAISIPELICQLLWLTAQAVDCKRKTSSFHSNRIAFYCHRIAKAFNSPEIDPLQALWAGLLHDIGSPLLTEEELSQTPLMLAAASKVYQQHPQVAAQLISSIKGLVHFAPILESHHEYLDGTGFPKGLAAGEIPLLSQIIILCEHYEMHTQGAQGDSHLYQQAIAELEKGRNTLFSEELLEKALPILQIWGPRDISWMRDIKNVHAFFTSDPLDGVWQEHSPPTHKQPTEDNEGSFVPRQWEHAELTKDFKFCSGASGLKAIAGHTDTADDSNFFDIIDPALLKSTKQSLATLQNKASLTLTLSSRYGKPLELLFLKQGNGYQLLYRGINEKPFLTRKHSIFYQHFRNTPEAELILDKDIVITDVNNSALILLGFPKQGMVGKSIESFFAPFLSKDQLSSLHMLLMVEDETMWLEEFSLIDNVGRPFAIRVTILPLPKVNDQEFTYLCRLKDVSLRKELEQEMQHRDHAMQLIVHNISGMTGERFFKALLLQFATLNESGTVLIGELTDNTTAIQPIAFQKGGNFYNKEKFSLNNSPCHTVINSGELFLVDRVQEHFPDDISLREQGFHAYWGLPLRSQDGTTIGVLVALDIKKILHSQSTQALVKVLQSLAGNELARMQSERVLKENKQQLEQQNLELTRMNQLKSDMIAVTSHDLKSPLSAIIGYASLLEQYFSSLEEEKKIYYIKRIEEEGQKQLAFINKLLDLYRIESGTIDLERTYERLDFIVNDCISRQQHIAAERNITIELSVQGTPEASLLDPLRMEQVISNILSNGIKFSPADKRILVRFFQDEQSITVEVCDCGKGIDEEEILHIFDRYYMGRTNFDIRAEGSGLGLYIVKNIISLHGGTVSARNRPKGGSCFSVQIPVKSSNKL